MRNIATFVSLSIAIVIWGVTDLASASDAGPRVVHVVADKEHIVKIHPGELATEVGASGEFIDLSAWDRFSLSTPYTSFAAKEKGVGKLVLGRLFHEFEFNNDRDSLQIKYRRTVYRDGLCESVVVLAEPIKTATTFGVGSTDDDPIIVRGDLLPREIKAPPTCIKEVDVTKYVAEISKSFGYTTKNAKPREIATACTVNDGSLLYHAIGASFQNPSSDAFCASAIELSRNKPGSVQWVGTGSPKSQLLAVNEGGGNGTKLVGWFDRLGRMFTIKKPSEFVTVEFSSLPSEAMILTEGRKVSKYYTDRPLTIPLFDGIAAVTLVKAFHIKMVKKITNKTKKVFVRLVRQPKLAETKK